MDLIHANADRAEIGVVSDFEKFDAQLHANCKIEDNTFALTMSLAAWNADKIMKDDFLYIDSTEFGGVVSSVEKDTGDDLVTVKGCLWRGMLAKRIIRPPAGQGYLTFENIELNAMISNVIGGMFGSLIEVSDANTGTTISAQFRYQTVLQGLSSALKKAGYTLSCIYEAIRQKAVLSARKITDYSDADDISPDLGIGMTTKAGRIDDYNHVIALGSGELEARTVIDLYMIDGKVYTARPASLPETALKSFVFDYPNAEDADTLTASATDALLGYAAESTAAVDTSQAQLDLLLDDVILVIDRDLSISQKKSVSQLLLTISSSGEKIETEVS